MDGSPRSIENPPTARRRPAAARARPCGGHRRELTAPEHPGCEVQVPVASAAEQSVGAPLQLVAPAVQ